MGWRTMLLGGALLIAGAMGPAAAQTAPGAAPPRIERAVLEDRIYAAWLGQLVGNIYGLPHENVHIDQPGPDRFPYGYDALEISYYQWHFGATRMTDVMRAFGGAFSDDDTDIEYVYLRLMEEAGPEPSYGQVRAAWMAHVDNWVWLANRQALALMHEGYAPPYTGRRGVNADWFQIDPQLINEIWALTAPGMIDYAAEKSAWGARISADEAGIEPTIAYGAMFAAAPFEPDIGKLIDIGAAALPPGSRFATIIAEMKALHRRFPADWRAARQEMARLYYLGQDARTRSIWDANLNGACAMLALLYGEGDFQRTLDLAAAMGFDADNQAATLAGLIGAARGVEAIPRNLLYPVEGWSQPFNDRYLNRSRRDMPSASIRDLARRTARLAERNLIAQGGRIVEEGGKTMIVVNPAARFTPPLEIPVQPEAVLVAGTGWRWPLHGGGRAPRWRVAEGALPAGVTLGGDGVLGGTPTRAGHFAATIEAAEGGRTARRRIAFHVVANNLAPAAGEVLGPAGALEGLRDGRIEDGEDVASASAPARLESFGYRWKAPVKAGAIIVTMGHMEEAAGWFTSLNAEYLTEAGQWAAIPGVAISPEPPLDNDKHLHAHHARYTISFPPIATRGIRVIGLNGGEGNARRVRVAELGVYRE